MTAKLNRSDWFILAAGFAACFVPFGPQKKVFWWPKIPKIRDIFGSKTLYQYYPKSEDSPGTFTDPLLAPARW